MALDRERQMPRLNGSTMPAPEPTTAGTPSPSSWWSQNAPTNPYTGGAIPTQVPGANIPENTGAQGPGATTGAIDYNEGWFTSTFGMPKTPQELVALESKLAQYGIKVRRNASGVAGDIELPNGQIVDVITNAMGGGGGFQWLPDAPGGTGGNGGWGGGGQTANFQTGTFTGGGQYPLAAVMGEGWNQPWTTPFVAPNDVTQQNDPGFQFRLKEGIDAIQRSAAAKGTLLTGGTMKDLNAWAQDFASNEYEKVYNRALGEYQQAYGIFNNNQNNAFNRNFSLAQLGLLGAQSQAENATGYGANSADNATGASNAQASGTVGAANNTATGIVNAVNNGLQWWMTNNTGRRLHTNDSGNQSAQGAWESPR